MRHRSWVGLLALSSISGLPVGCDGDGGGDAGAAPPAGAQGEGEGEGDAPAGPAAFELRFHRESTGHMQFSAPITAERLAQWAESGPDPDAVEQIPELAGLPSRAWFSADGAWVAWLKDGPDLHIKLGPTAGGDIVDLDVGDRFDDLDTRSFGFAGAWAVFGIADGDRLEIRAQQAGGGADSAPVIDLESGGGFIVDPVRPRVLANAKTSLNATQLRLVATDGGDPEVLAELTVQGDNTGGDYTGQEPGAFSPDGRWIALVTGGREAFDIPGELRLRVFSTTVGAGGEIGGVRLGPAGQGSCQAERAPGEYSATRSGVHWAADAGAVYVIGINRVGCGFNGVNDATGVLRIPVGADGVPGPASVVLADDHPGEPMVIHDVALHPAGAGPGFVVAIQTRDRARGTALYWASPDSGVPGLVQLTEPGSADSDEGPRIR